MKLFLRDLIDFLKNMQKEVLNYSFSFEDNISYSSTSFMLNNQTYIVYPTKERVKFFLKIFNISSKQNIQKNYSFTQITFLSTYPKYAIYDQKKSMLYWTINRNQRTPNNGNLF